MAHIDSIMQARMEAAGWLTELMSKKVTPNAGLEVKRLGNGKRRVKVRDGSSMAKASTYKPGLSKNQYYARQALQPCYDEKKNAEVRTINPADYGKPVGKRKVEDHVKAMALRISQSIEKKRTTVVEKTEEKVEDTPVRMSHETRKALLYNYNTWVG